MAGHCASGRAAGLAQPRRRLLRHHARAHPRHRPKRSRRIAPRQPPASARAALRLAGLEPLNVDDQSLFVNVGERTNVTGSKAFARLILAGDYAGALAVARQQVENGAQVIDVNMDEAMLDSEKAMTTFLSLVAAEPDIARVPVMIDSSKWSVIEAGLKCVQGKPIVNSISHEGGRGRVPPPGKPLPPVRRGGGGHGVRREGAGRHPERRTEVCRRAYDLLIQQADFPPEDIIFDPNIFAVATGTRGARALRHRLHRSGALDPRQSARARKVSGGVSNLSFSFRGNDAVREAMHTAFLYHAIGAGMSMGIVNAGQLGVYEQLDPELASGSRTCCSTAGRTPPSGWSSSPRRSRPAQGKPHQGRSLARQPASRSA